MSFSVTVPQSTRFAGLLRHGIRFPAMRCPLHRYLRTSRWHILSEIGGQLVKALDPCDGQQECFLGTWEST